MEGSKNAMYAQAGRSRGWTQGMQESTPPRTAPAVTVSEQPVAPPPVAEMAPVIPVPAIPEPPVAVLPMPPVIEAPAAELPLRPIAEAPIAMMSATATVEMESTTMSVPMPMPMPMPAQPEEREHPFKGCETPVMAYIPIQRWGDLYEAEQGFSRGTIFPKLDLPFVGEGACRRE